MDGRTAVRTQRRCWRRQCCLHVGGASRIACAKFAYCSPSSPSTRPDHTFSTPAGWCLPPAEPQDRPSIPADTIARNKKQETRNTKHGHTRRWQGRGSWHDHHRGGGGNVAANTRRSSMCLEQASHSPCASVIARLRRATTAGPHAPRMTRAGSDM